MKKKYKWQILAILLPIVSLLLVYYLMDFYPFGNKSIYISDLYAQYRGFLMYTKNIILGKESIQFSWDFFGGSNMMGNFAYYMGSIFNIVLIFVPAKYFYFGVVVIIGLKFSGISYAMFTFLDYSFNNKKMFSLILGLSYTFSGMLVGYFFNIIWLDGFLFLPLIIMELLHLLKTKILRKRYIIFVFLMIIANFYIAYMVALFAVIFLFSGFFNSYYSPKDSSKALLKVVTYSIIGLLLASIIIVPMVFQLIDGIRNKIPSTELNFSINKMISKLFNGVYLNRSFIDNSNSVYPHIYAGFLPLLLLPVYFCSKKIDKRERISSGIILFIFLISFIIPEIGKIWHAFTFPTGFPYRFAFLFSFFIILLCARGIESGIGFEVNKISISFVMWSIVLVYLLIMKDLDFLIWFWNQFLLTSIYIFSLFVNFQKLNGKIAILALSFIFMEVTVHQVQTLTKLDRATPFTDYDKNMGNSISEFELYQKFFKTSDTPFKKVVSTYNSFDTDNIYYGFPSVSGFSSMVNKKYLVMLSNLGYSSSAVRVKRDGGTIITDILLGNQYRIEPIETANNENKQYEQVKSGNYSHLLKSSFDTPIGLLFADNVVLEEPPSDIQNRIIESLGDTADDYIDYYQVLHSSQLGVKIENNEIYQTEEIASLTFELPEIDENKLLYVYFPTRISNNVSYILNGEKYLVEPGWHLLDSTVGNELFVMWQENQILYDFSLQFMTIDGDKINSLMSRQVSQGVTINELTKRSFSGTLEINNKNNLVLPIPYDKGWTFCVNNQEITAEVGFGGLIALTNLPKNRTITISGKYQAPGLYLGTALSGMGLGILLICFTIEIRDKNKSNSN